MPAGVVENDNRRAPNLVNSYAPLVLIGMRRSRGAPLDNLGITTVGIPASKNVPIFASSTFAGI